MSSSRAVLVGLYPTSDDLSPDHKLAELAALVRAAGGEAVASLWQPERSDRGPRISTLVGRGKVEEVKAAIAAHEAGLVVFDNPLSPAQVRSLEKELECRVIDRSELILDIFGRRARTREAALQVELAQLEYTAPRLRGLWTHLGRQAGQGGGQIGGRGPGEKQIEIDRRGTRRRLGQLRGELQALQERRGREVARRKEGTFTVGLVGYTNAGKSTLLNALTAADTLAEDALFATLHTLSRRWEVRPGLTVVLSDTVGFVRDLPHHLVASFRATLEEALHADLLLHVIDASHPHARGQAAAVDDVLGELGRDPADMIRVLNKADLGSGLAGPGIVVSARTGQGLDALAAAVADRVARDWVEAEVRAPLANGRVRAFAHAEGEVRSERFDEGGWWARVLMSKRSADALVALGAELADHRS